VQRCQRDYKNRHASDRRPSSDRPSLCSARWAVELGHELTVGRPGSGELVASVLEFELHDDDVPFEGGDPGLELLAL
jgi:hypothetical protein